MTAASFHSMPDADGHFAVATADGGSVPVYRLDGPAGAPALLFGHANGLAAGSYGPWLRSLATAARVFAFDARGHGGARWPEGPLAEVFHVDRFADDLARIIAAVSAGLDGAPLLYVGHSLGGAAALRLAARGGAAPWAGTMLFEPPIFPPPGAPHFAAAMAMQDRLVRSSARRRADWPSPEALHAFLGSRGVFAGFRGDLLESHCRACLRPLPGGGYTLCCPPAVEAAIFEDHRNADTWSRFGRIALPLDLVGGDPRPPASDWVTRVMAEMAAALPAARLTTVPNAGHMMILEQPETCRGLVLERLAALPPRHA
jgi:pimeloyl-ACP methyl ester carboxylesterase